jgi:alkyl sulfatase BDS1-like metallo-beta-lactamase superfamily hydrolase
MGWYDANPASLHALPPVAAATHYVAAMGGAEAAMAKAQAAIDGGEYRWAAMLLNHVVFAEPENAKAKNLLAEVYTQLGYRAEAGTWRNIYLTGAQELRHGVIDWPTQRLSLALIAATPTTMMLDFAAVRLNPDRAKDVRLKINLVLPDLNETHLISVENSVATVTMERSDMLETLLAGVPVGLKTTSGAIKVDGTPEAYADLVGLIDPVDPNFPVVTP